DPSCGSGNFLINIIIKILDSKEPIKSKIEAISNVYGFDINPLAVMTVRVNIFLLLLEYFNNIDYKISNFNIFLVDSLFPELYEKESKIDFNNLYNSFDLVIGNPPWITYKDLENKPYQIKIRNLANELGIRPPSQYITHIELAAIFFYAIPFKFLKQSGMIFLVMPKSVLNGDHCHKFRAFSLFNENLEIWDFPKHYFFNVNHICLKAEYIGRENIVLNQKKYPIKTKLFNNNLELVEKTLYSSLKIDNDGAKLLLPIQELEVITKLEESLYKEKFFQGATLVPRTLVFFKKKQEKNGYSIISSDLDILRRSKKQWKFPFKNKVIEERFQFKTFLNMDMLPFYIKHKKDVFLPVNEQLDFDLYFLQNYPKALEFYQEMDSIYQRNKKKTSRINTLFANLNYWNKLKKQVNNKTFIVVYNASGSNLKSAVINNDKQKLIIGSENYYYSTNSENEAYYLSAILNAPILSKYIKLVKSSRHIHKRPFMFPIPLFDENNIIHRKLAKKGMKYHTIVQDLFLNNPKIQSSKVRLIINRKLMKLDKLTKQLIFK
ncbi:MAG: Eco57I restriction-modification methylase domain-containing protein, partial [Promethearchaeota archaeon]